MESLAQEVAQEVGVAEHIGVVAFTDLMVVALACQCIAALAEVEYEHYRVVHIAGVVQADYRNHDGELVRTADKTGVGELEHQLGEC